MSDDTLASAHAGTPASTGDEAYCPACGESFSVEVARCPKDGARLVKLKAQVDPMLGRVLDERYEVRAALGEGGMGTVYRGWQLSVDREVAIKVIHAKLASDRIAVKRFLREARLSSRLTQPSIVNVYDFGQSEDGTLFLVMELLKGQTLASVLEPMRPLPLKRVVTIALQLCDALESAHGQGIIHRDLKPGNIIILDDPPGRDLVKVLDFGLAKSLLTETTSVVTHSNALLGTPLYMPPEQIDGRPTDQASDFYSYGCILYQMITGRPPFLGDSVNLVLASHLHDPVPPLPPHIPASIAQMVTWMMTKEPTERVSSARAVRDAFEQALAAGLPPEPAMPDLSMEHLQAAGYSSTQNPMALGSASPASGAMARTMIGPGVSGQMRVSGVQPAQAISTSGVPRASTGGVHANAAVSLPHSGLGMPQVRSSTASDAPNHGAPNTMFGAVKRRAGHRARAMMIAGVAGVFAMIAIIVVATRGGDDAKPAPVAPASVAPTATPTATPTVTPIDEPATPTEKTVTAPPVEKTVAAPVQVEDAPKVHRRDKRTQPKPTKVVDAEPKKAVVDPFEAKVEPKIEIKKSEPKVESKPEQKTEPKVEPKKTETKKAPSIDFYKKP